MPHPSSRRERLAELAFLALVPAVAVLAVALALRLPAVDLAPMALPEGIELCGRSYEGSAASSVVLEQVRRDLGLEPLIVDARDHPACVEGACSEVAQDGPCHTVVYVRVSDTEVVACALQGGP